EQVARDLNLSFSIISAYERNERQPPVDKLQMLAKYYDTTVAYLLGETDDPRPPKGPPSLQETIAAIGGMPLKPIPIIGTIHAGASSWAAEIPEGWTAIPEEQAR